MSLIVLDRQHVGKPNNLEDLGAYSELSQEHEAHMVGRYMLELEWTLRKLGHRVVTLSDGYYSHRHKRANNLFAKESGACLYLAGHLNAGGGDYGALFYDHRSAMGADAATFIGMQLSKIEGIEDTKLIEAKPTDWTKNAFNTIDDIYLGRACGICLEPFFVDCKSHAHLMGDDGLDKIGNAIAVGIDAWVSSMKRG